MEETNKAHVVALYSALGSFDVDAVHSLLAADLGWWFHGPPSTQFLKRLLTGSTNLDESQPFIFIPVSIAAFGNLVLAEGCGPGRSTAWVHAWTVTDGIITHIREYFNTAVTVTRLGNGNGFSPETSSSSGITAAGQCNRRHCQPVWKSSLQKRVGRSVPGLVLALQ